MNTYCNKCNFVFGAGMVKLLEHVYLVHLDRTSAKKSHVIANISVSISEGY